MCKLHCAQQRARPREITLFCNSGDGLMQGWQWSQWSSMVAQMELKKLDKSNRQLQQELVALRLENYFEINAMFENPDDQSKYIMVTKKDVDVLTLCDFKGFQHDTDDCHKRDCSNLKKFGRKM
ncbi:hypothetical protein F8M41_006223 [Gigaspora margarita]|uniref:Uncharacterized protein n=1 Tax=Gigaspora margarita TaxID=4874 RepID=A0A8H3X9V7_GIGMA|nr:hypothetical protein F8M41_006223 [Gigaspora margarita]